MSKISPTELAFTCGVSASYMSKLKKHFGVEYTTEEIPKILLIKYLSFRMKSLGDVKEIVEAPKKELKIVLGLWLTNIKRELSIIEENYG